ncbi:endoplasmic oxidoreductin [Eremomyces bilateralis CBS 781.70]|uniref:Endoplasmic oxidoreductin n=1 Tax=Eremomyces bilateralis CBS 781.70 TaxID=1392243 RepID=A0A6G1FV73_9PEZI|nr:endoplasmic oxidoreductin [Eremomyces bilateralis CBS 781.70]KAF1809663.1 endoplasmic oxidoreductin [Eremomyces bilateralis CBS 781.70]
MKSAARVFYLAVFTLLGSTHAGEDARGTPSSSVTDPSPNVCAFEPGAVVSDACATYSTLENLNSILQPYVQSITQNTDFFSYYRVNLYNKKCPFWSEENEMCGNIACAVNTLDNEEDIPLVWRASELGKLEGPKATHPGRREQGARESDRPLQGELGESVEETCVLESDDECDERDYCIPEDERASSKGDYVSLVDNPERFTGYAGVGAQQVWETIYGENCFTKEPAEVGISEESSTWEGSLFQAQAARDLRSVLHEQGVQQQVQNAIAKGKATSQLDGLEFEDSCIEKRVFYRVVSGMHTSITAHICADYLNQTTGQWGPNLECYLARLHDYPERLSNMYFNYALLLRATSKLRNHVTNYKYCSADPEQDRLTKRLVLSLADAIPSGHEIFDETVMFQSPDAVGLKEDFRNRFRNISRIMDCVGCDKCRLWGKLQTAGYGTALKVLFEFDENDPSKDPPLRRTELVALVNTLGRVSRSLHAVQQFRHMLEERVGRPVVQNKTHRERVEESKSSGSPATRKKGEKVDDDGYPDFSRRPSKGLTTIEIFWEEVDLVWRAYKFVLKSWIAFPGRLWNIIILESSRLWDFWLGLPITRRSWQFKFPGRDALYERDEI